MATLPSALLVQVAQYVVDAGLENLHRLVLAAIAVPDNITVSMRFFIGCKVSLPEWSLVIPNPTVLIVRQTIAHYYTYAAEPDGSLRGGEVVELNIT